MSTAKRDEKCYYSVYVHFIFPVGIKVSQSRPENPQGVHRFFFEVKRLKGFDSLKA